MLSIMRLPQMHGHQPIRSDWAKGAQGPPESTRSSGAGSQATFGRTPHREQEAASLGPAPLRPAAVPSLATRPYCGGPQHHLGSDSSAFAFSLLGSLSLHPPFGLLVSC